MMLRLGVSLRFAATRVCAAAAAVAGLASLNPRHAQCDGEKTSRQLAGEDRLSAWHGGLGSAEAHLNRGDLEDVDRNRHVVAMIGITGGGKSSTANTLMSRQGKKKGAGGDGSTGAGRGNQNLLGGNRNRKFKEADSLTSVTRSVSFRDYEFSGVPFRIIDTPGLADTNRSSDEIETELDIFKRIARCVCLWWRASCCVIRWWGGGGGGGGGGVIGWYSLQKLGLLRVGLTSLGFCSQCTPRAVMVVFAQARRHGLRDCVAAGPHHCGG